MRRGRLNLVLVAVAGALGVAVYLSQEKEEKGPPLTPHAPDAVTRIAIAHPGSAAIRLEKRDGGWHLTEPVAAEADEFEVSALLGMADRETKETLANVKLEELELAPPKYTITLNDTTIAIGGVEPLQYRRYVQVGETVYLVEDPPGAAFDADYADLVAKDVLRPGAEIERIALPKLALAKGADGNWALTPSDPNAGADQMQKLVDAWKGARSMWNELAKDKVKGERVVVTLKGGIAREFVVAAREPQLKLHRPDLGVNLVMSKALVDELLRLPDPPKADAKPEEANPAEAKPADGQAPGEKPDAAN